MKFLLMLSAGLAAYSEALTHWPRRGGMVGPVLTPNLPIVPVIRYNVGGCKNHLGAAVPCAFVDTPVKVEKREAHEVWDKSSTDYGQYLRDHEPEHYWNDVKRWSMITGKTPIPRDSGYTFDGYNFKQSEPFPGNRELNQEVKKRFQYVANEHNGNLNEGTGHPNPVSPSTWNHYQDHVFHAYKPRYDNSR